MAIEVKELRAIIYPRVSDPYGGDKITLETQAAAMVAHCEKRGHKVLAILRELHTGQELWERPVMSEIREMMARREFDVLVAYSVDRLARDPVHLSIILGEADHYGVEIEFATEEFAKSPEAMFLLQAKGFAAKLEAQLIAERTMRARVARVKSGRLQGQGGAPYGYAHEQTTGTRVIVEHEAAVVREIFRLSAEGWGTPSIAKRLNTEAVPPPSVGRKRLKFEPRWSIRTVDEILKRPAYKGEIHSMRYKASKALKRSVLRPREEWIDMPEGVCPAIVSAELWDRVQLRRTGPRGAEARNQQRPFLLRGMVRCGRCRRMCSPQISHGREVYRCCSRHTSAGACGAGLISASRLEEWVWSEVVRHLEQPDLIAREVSALRERDGTSAAVSDEAAVRRALEKVLAKQERLIGLLASDDPDFPADIIRGQLSRLRSEREQLEGELARLVKQRRDQEAARAELGRLAEVCERLAGKLHTLDFERRRKLLQGMDARVWADGQDWRLVAGVPLEGVHAIESEAGGVPTASAP